MMPLSLDIGETFQSSRVRRRYKQAAVKLSALFDEVTSIIVTDDNPKSWSVAINLPEYREQDFGPQWYEDYQGERSTDQLLEWVTRGGLPAHVAGRKGSFVVVRLVSYVKEHSCFGISFDCESGRQFSIITNETAGDSEALRRFFKDKGAKLNLPKRKSIASHFKDAPCHLVLPVI